MIERVVFYSRADCHLCEVARPVVREACELTGTGWIEVDVDGSAELRATYGDRVPAVTVDGALHGYWRIDGNALHAALA